MLDLTHMLWGPYGAMLLTELGMRTIKVEQPGSGGTRKLLSQERLERLKEAGVIA